MVLKTSVRLFVKIDARSPKRAPSFVIARRVRVRSLLFFPPQVRSGYCFRKPWIKKASTQRLFRSAAVINVENAKTPFAFSSGSLDQRLGVNCSKLDGASVVSPLCLCVKRYTQASLLPYFSTVHCPNMAKCRPWPLPGLLLKCMTLLFLALHLKKQTKNSWGSWENPS